MLHICAYIILLFSPNLHCLQQVDECGSMEDFTSRTISVKYSFSNFSFKVQIFIFLILTSSLVSRYWLASLKVKKMIMTFFFSLLYFFILRVEYLSASFDELRSHEAKCKQRKCFQFLIPAKMHNSNQKPGNISVTYKLSESRCKSKRPVINVLK